MPRVNSLSRRVCPLPLLALPIIAAGCSSGGSALRNIPVTYTFENVRSDAAGDEWTSIRRVLVEHSAGTPKIKPGQSRSLGSAKITTYQVELVAPSLKSLDAIQAGIEQLEEGERERDRVRFSLVSLAAGYRSNAVAAGVQTSVAGIATPGYTVRLVAAPGRPAQTVVAGRDGTWSARLEVPPQTAWIYGVSEDPLKRDRPAYFRVSVLSGTQERTDAGDFARLFGPTADPKARPAPAAAAEKPVAPDPDAQRLERQRRAEEERFKRERQRDAKRRVE